MGAEKKAKTMAKKAARSAAGPAAGEVPAFDLVTAYGLAIDRMHSGHVEEAAGTFARCYVEVCAGVLLALSFH